MSSNKKNARPADPVEPTEPEEELAPNPFPLPELDRDHYWIDDFQSEHRSVIRPYVRTGGRAHPAYELRLETLLSATWPGSPALLPSARRTPDLEAIRELCSGEPLSVAEISAHMSLALGVARVLICDAINAGLLVMHEDAVISEGGPSVELMVRVHKGLRRMG
jgi:hypothetical protein